LADLWKLIWCALAGLFRPRASLEAEILVLRHQLNVLHRKSPERATFSSLDRMVFAALYAIAPNVLDALRIVKPETVIRWHRAGVRTYWRWKSRCLDHVVVFGERHLLNLLRSYQRYYNECRTHLSLGKDAPRRRAIQDRGRIAINPVLGGLHHQYCRV
jgi:hypothetical protein